MEKLYFKNVTQVHTDNLKYNMSKNHVKLMLSPSDVNVF
jgi:hypothetical protein